MNPKNKGFSLSLLIFFLSFIFYTASGQKNYTFRIYTQEDGLASSLFNGLAQDSTGFLWLLSENGLNRFDGYAFKVFKHAPHDAKSLTSSNLLSIQINSRKDILFETENSISQYCASTGSFLPLFSFNNPEKFVNYLFIGDVCWILNSTSLYSINYKTQKKEQFSLPLGFFARKNTLIKEMNGLIWLSCNHIILCFDPIRHSFTQIETDNSDITDSQRLHEPLLFFTNENSEIFYFSEDGIFKFNEILKAFVQRFKISPGFTSSTENSIQKVFLINKNYIAIEREFNFIQGVDITNGNTFNIPLKDSLFKLNDPVRLQGMNLSDDGSVLVSSSNAGVYKIDFAGRSVQDHIFHDDKNYGSLVSNNITYALEIQRTLWMCSPGIGLIKAERDYPTLHAFSPENTKTSPLTNIKSVNELDKSNLLIGTLNGLFRFDKSNNFFSRVISPLNGEAVLQNEAISSIITDATKNIWIASRGRNGITVLNYKNKTHVKIVPDDNPSNPEYNALQCIFIDSHNYLWVGTDGDIIYRLDLKSADFSKKMTCHFEKFEGKVIKGDTLIYNTVFCITEVKPGQVLFGTQNGLYAYDYSTNFFGRYRYSTGHSSLSDDYIRCMYYDKEGKLWIGTNGGGLNLTDKNLDHFKYITKEDGLPDNSICSILEGDKEDLWLGTSKGLCCFNPRKNSFRSYYDKDGVQNFEFNTNSAFKTSSGELVFGGISGFNIFYPDSLTFIPDIPKIIISEFTVNEKSFPLSESIVLNYDQNSISFQFAALSFYRSRENLYAYKLDGINKNWVYCERRRFSNYAGLDPGKYTFHVKACNFNGIWNDKGITVQFTIRPPFWQTWWFRILMVLTLAAIIYILFRYALYQKLKVEAFRNRIARDLHDEIGSNLSSISLFSSVAREKAAPDLKSDSLLVKISEYTIKSQEAINDIVWLVNAKNDSFEKIIVRMRKLAGEMLEAKNICLHLNFDEQMNDLKLHMDTRKSIYLIYKEALNNIVKYADCKNVWIDLQQKDKKFILKIKDDGHGFVSSEKIHGNGLINMKERAKEIKGTLLVQSEIGTGTMIVLEFDN